MAPQVDGHDGQSPPVGPTPPRTPPPGAAMPLARSRPPTVHLGSSRPRCCSPSRPAWPDPGRRNLHTLTATVIQRRPVRRPDRGALEIWSSDLGDLRGHSDLGVSGDLGHRLSFSETSWTVPPTLSLAAATGHRRCGTVDDFQTGKPDHPDHGGPSPRSARPSSDGAAILNLRRSARSTAAYGSPHFRRLCTSLTHSTATFAGRSPRQ